MLKAEATISDFERIQRVGLGHLLVHMAASPFTIVTAYQGRGEPLGETDDIKSSQAELKNRIWQLGYGYVSTRGAWKTGADLSFIKDHSLFLPNVTADQALSLAREFDLNDFLVGSDGRTHLITSAGAVASPQLGHISDLLDLVHHNRILTRLEATTVDPKSDPRRLFYCYVGRPPTGIAKFGFLDWRENRSLPVAHFSTLIDVPGWA